MMTKKKHMAVCLLAAGKGKRTFFPKPKPLLPLLDYSLLWWVFKALQKTFSKESCSSFIPTYFPIIGYEKELVRQELLDLSQKENLNVHFIEQRDQKGTGHALQCFFEQRPIHYSPDFILVVCADTPLLSPDSLEKLIKEENNGKNDDVKLLSFMASNPFGLGRIIRDSSFKLVKIVEEKDASPQEKNIQEVNSGIVLFRAKFFQEHIAKITQSSITGEIYLTDLVEMSSKKEAILFENESDFLGINTLQDLSYVEQMMKEKIFQQHRLKGVIVMDAVAMIGPEVVIEAGAIIYPGVMLLGRTTIRKGVVIGAFSIIKNSFIDVDVCVKEHCVIESSVVKEKAEIGPFARLRPDSILGEKVKIGNFVEIKKSQLDADVKVSHLSYVGDTFIGQSSNIGCGFITCNYDGEKKHNTHIGKNCFIGSDCQAIAPVSIGDDSIVAAGTTITDNVPSSSFAIARTKQMIKKNKKKKDFLCVE